LPLGLSKWSSWKFESEGDHLHLINQAAIEGPNLKFFADDVDLYVNTNKVVASGNVVFTNADGRISAERLEFDTGTGIGTFYDASGIMSLGQQAGTNPRHSAARNRTCISTGQSWRNLARASTGLLGAASQRACSRRRAGK
jgi:lipopolysaccharide export system protein LptA